MNEQLSERGKMQRVAILPDCRIAVCSGNAAWARMLGLPESVLWVCVAIDNMAYISIACFAIHRTIHNKENWASGFFVFHTENTRTLAFPEVSAIYRAIPHYV